MDNFEFLSDLDEDFIDNFDVGFEFYESITDWTWFRHLWLDSACCEEYFELAQSVKPELEKDQWDYGWQYRLVNHPDYSRAQVEFINILIGWF